MAVTQARRRAEEYLLAPRMLRSLTSGEMIDRAWTRVSFPPRWHYDLLHPDRLPFDMEVQVGSASRWNTLRALRVLAWYGR